MMKSIYYGMVLTLFLSINFCRPVYSVERVIDDSTCTIKKDSLTAVKYEWRLAVFSKSNKSSFPVNIIIERKRRLPEAQVLQAPFEIKLVDDFDYVAMSRSGSGDGGYMALRRILVKECKEARVVHELSTEEPLVVFKHADHASVRVIPAPDSKNYYSGDLENLWGRPDIRTSRSHQSLYTYPYSYCADLSQDAVFPQRENEFNYFFATAQLFYCHMKSGQRSRHKLVNRIKKPLAYTVRYIGGENTKKLSAKEFVDIPFCCGDVRPTLEVKDRKGYLRRDRYGSGEGEGLEFEFDKKDKKWKLSRIIIDNY